jgi:arylsulfatase A-like enzyme
MRAVFVLFDSLNRSALECYGGAAVRTPNFRRFAERAVTFDTHYVGSLPCMPARRDMHTGRVNFLHRGWGPLEPFDNSFPEILKQSGVLSHIVTDHNHYVLDGGATYLPRYSSFELVRGNGNDHWKGDARRRDEEFARRFHPSQARPFLTPYMVNRDYIVAEEEFACPQVFGLGERFLETNRDADNWLLQLESFDPHEPFHVPARFKADYPTNYAGPILDWPLYGRPDLAPDEAAEVRSNYAALVAMCDAYFGRLLDTFDAYDLWRDTALVVTTDHGFLLGEHDWWGKNVMPIYDDLARVPLMIYHPDHARRGGERRRALTQTTDIMPTLLEIFGRPVPSEVQGHSLLPLLEEDRPIREAAIYGYFGAACNVTDGRHTYFRYPPEMSADNLHEYTLMPTRMTRRMALDDLRGATLHPPFDFTKGVPVLKVGTPKTADGLPAVMENRSYADTVTALYDTERDPGQTERLDDPATEARMTGLLAGLLAATDAPAEIYDRLDVARPAAADRPEPVAG